MVATEDHSRRCSQELGLRAETNDGNIASLSLSPTPAPFGHSLKRHCDRRCPVAFRLELTAVEIIAPAGIYTLKFVRGLREEGSCRERRDREYKFRRHQDTLQRADFRARVFAAGPFEGYTRKLGLAIVSGLGFSCDTVRFLLKIRLGWCSNLPGWTVCAIVAFRALEESVLDGSRGEIPNSACEVFEGVFVLGIVAQIWWFEAAGVRILAIVLDKLLPSFVEEELAFSDFRNPEISCFYFLVARIDCGNWRSKIQSLNF
ncbi:hypothetical protein ACLOJK_002223 [Asimina triloba]